MGRSETNCVVRELEEASHARADDATNGIGDAVKGSIGSSDVFETLSVTMRSVRHAHRVGVNSDGVARLIEDQLHHQQAASPRFRNVVELENEAAIRGRSTRLEADSADYFARIPVGPRKRDHVIRIGGVGDIIRGKETTTDDNGRPK